jgi:hypothetical protein
MMRHRPPPGSSGWLGPRLQVASFSQHPSDSRVGKAALRPRRSSPLTLRPRRPPLIFAKVLGSIAPIDPAAQLINFEINLPVAWNRKAVQYCGYNGTLITGLAPLRDAEPDDPPPLARGAGNGSGPSGFRICAKQHRPVRPQ